MKKKILIIALCHFLFLVSCGAGQKSSNPQIADLLITSNEQNVLLYARLINGFRPDIESEIIAGVPKEYTLQFRVYEERSSYIWDKRIKSGKIRRTIKYDNLKKTFNIYASERPEPVEFGDLNSAQNAMADFNGVAVIPIADLQKNKKYYLNAKIVINKVRLPLRLERAFFFVSYWDCDTVWYNKSFILK